MRKARMEAGGLSLRQRTRMLSLIHRGWLHRRRGRSNGRKGWRAPRIRNDRGGKVPNIATRIAPACQQHRACRGLREWTTRPPRRALLRRAPHLPLMLTLRSEDCMPMQLHPSQHGPCCVGPGSAPCTPCAAHCCVASESSLLECGLCVGSRGVNRPVRLWACGGCRNLCPRARPHHAPGAGPAPHTRVPLSSSRCLDGPSRERPHGPNIHEYPERGGTDDPRGARGKF